MLSKVPTEVIDKGQEGKSVEIKGVQGQEEAKDMERRDRKEFQKVLTLFFQKKSVMMICSFEMDK